MPPVPAAVRTRVVARAQAVLLVPATSQEERLFVPARHAAGRRWAAAATLVGVTALAAGAGAYVFRARLGTTRPDVAAKAPAAEAPRPGRHLGIGRGHVAPANPVIEEDPSRLVSDLVEPLPEPLVELPRLARSEGRLAELRLLRRARDAVLHKDFSAALVPIAEHTRRFKDGGLAEEREALRVKALAGLGRTVEAQRAAAAFKARYPRSVLSPAVGQMPLPPDPATRP